MMILTLVPWPTTPGSTKTTGASAGKGLSRRSNQSIRKTPPSKEDSTRSCRLTSRLTISRSRGGHQVANMKLCMWPPSWNFYTMSSTVHYRYRHTPHTQQTAHHPTPRHARTEEEGPPSHEQTMNKPHGSTRRSTMIPCTPSHDVAERFHRHHFMHHTRARQEISHSMHSTHHSTRPVDRRHTHHSKRFSPFNAPHTAAEGPRHDPNQTTHKKQQKHAHTRTHTAVAEGKRPIVCLI